MAQIWFYVGLSIILGLSSVIECGIIHSNEDEGHAFYNSMHRGEIVNKKHSCGATDNPPIFYKNCFYPYLDGVSHGCHHYILFGNRTQEDKIIFKQEYKKPDTKQLPMVIKAEFPKNNERNDGLIDFIAIDDFNGSETVHQDKVCITKGGIGQKYVEILIETRKRWGIRGYNVAIYGK